MKQLFLLIALLSVLTFSANATTTFNISGRITDSFGNGAPHVIISAASGDCNLWQGVAVQDSVFGYYNFNVPTECEDLIIFASKKGWFFDPSGYVYVKPLVGDQLNVDFVLGDEY